MPHENRQESQEETRGIVRALTPSNEGVQHELQPQNEVEKTAEAIINFQNPQTKR